MKKSAEKRYIFISNVLDRVIEIRGWESGNKESVIVSTIKITTVAGVAAEQYVPFKVGHESSKAVLVGFAEDFG